MCLHGKPCAKSERTDRGEEGSESSSQFKTKRGNPCFLLPTGGEIGPNHFILCFLFTSIFGREQKAGFKMVHELIQTSSVSEWTYQFVVRLVVYL